MANPFSNRGIVKSLQYFWGRDAELQDLYGLLLDSEDQPQSIALIGQRRIGKSSLMYRIYKQQLATSGYTEQLKRTCCIMVTMQAFVNASTEQFFERIIEDIVDSGGRAAELVKEIPHRSSLENEQVFVRLLRKMEREQLLLVLLLDEFERAYSNEQFDLGFYDRLRSYAQERRLAYIVGTQQSLDYKPELVSSPFSSPFFNFFQTYRLHGFRLDHVDELLQLAAKQIPHTLSSDELLFIRRVGGNFPFFLNVAADFLIREIKRGKMPVDFENLYTSILTDMSINGNFRYYVENLYEDQMQLLRQIARSPLKPPIAAQLQPPLRWLQHMSLVRLSADNTYIPFSDAFTDFLEKQRTANLSERVSHPYPCRSERLTDDVFKTLLKSLITDDENMLVEFKVAAKYNPYTNKADESMKNNVIEAVVSFMNSEGGLLVIGVDKHQQICDLSPDFEAADPSKRNKDGYELWLRNTLENSLGADKMFYYDVVFHIVEGRNICCIRIRPADMPVYLNGDLIVRAGNKKKKLKAEEAADYSKLRWPK